MSEESKRHIGTLHLEFFLISGTSEVVPQLQVLLPGVNLAPALSPAAMERLRDLVPELQLLGIELVLMSTKGDLVRVEKKLAGEPDVRLHAMDAGGPEPGKKLN